MSEEEEQFVGEEDVMEDLSQVVDAIFMSNLCQYISIFIDSKTHFGETVGYF